MAEANKKKLFYLEYENQLLRKVIMQYDVQMKKLQRDNNVIVQQLLNARAQLRQ